MNRLTKNIHNFDKYYLPNQNHEFEIRIGYFDESKKYFNTHIEKELLFKFIRCLSEMGEYQSKKRIRFIDTIYKHPRKMRIRKYLNQKIPQEIIQKRNVRKQDIILEENCYDLRLSIQEERPLEIITPPRSQTTQNTLDKIFYKDRITFNYTERFGFNIDCTHVSYREELCFHQYYQMEIEITRDEYSGPDITRILKEFTKCIQKGTLQQINSVIID